MKSIMLLLLFTSCLFIFTSRNRSPRQAQDVSKISQLSTHVYYIYSYNNQFSELYEKFLSDVLPKNYEVVNVFCDIVGGYGTQDVYFIIIKERE